MSIPLTLVEALVSWADSQPLLGEWFPGGIYQGLMPTGTRTNLPYLTFTQSGSRPINIIGTTAGVSFLEIILEARATGAEEAGRIGEAARDLILTAPPLAYAGGAESGRFLVDGEVSELEDGMGPDGSDVWAHRIPITFCTARW